METGNEPVAVLLERLAARRRPAWARWALREDADGWHVHHAEISVGAPPLEYTDRRWSYRGHLFIESPIGMDTLADLLHANPVELGDVHATPASLYDASTWAKLPSNTDYGGQRLPWPITRYEVSTREPVSANSGMQPLISVDAPSFAHYEAAFTAFFRPGRPSRWQQTSGVVVTDVDLGARISAVEIRPAQVLVTVAGDQLAGCSLQVSSGGSHQTVEIAASGEYTFALPDPLFDELMVVLADSQWRDIRVVYTSTMQNAQDATITWEAPEEQLEAVIAGGEGTRLEFKSALPEDRKSVRTSLKAIPAFANGAGGLLIFGVADDGTVTGLAGDSDEAMRRLANLINDLVHPQPPLEMERVVLNGKQVLLVHIAEGSDKPYGLERNPPQFFIRRGATTFPATREEIIALAAPVNRTPGQGW